MSTYLAIFKTELRTVIRNSSEMTTPVLFFLMVCTLFPLAVSPDAEVLQTLGPGVVWVAALLATLLSLEGLFRTDYDDGTLEQMMLSPQSDFFLVLVKVISRWCVTGLPLVVVAPVLGVMFHLSENAIIALFLSLLVGTPILTLVGAIGAALTLLIRNGGVLLSLLVLPLFLPVLIFGTGSVYSEVEGFSNTGEILWLGALLSLSIVLAPLAIVGSLRLSLTNG